MSRKKNKKVQITTPVISTSQEVNEEVALIPSKKEQAANMLFNAFLKKTMKIFNHFENDFIMITPYAEKDSEEKDDGSDIACYEIVSKSNQDIVVYVDDKEIYVSLKGAGVKMSDDEITILTANVLGYIKSHCPTAA